MEIVTTIKQGRQGDVLVIRGKHPQLVKAQNFKRVEPDKNRVILAYGEVTGHAHALPAEHVDLFWDEATGFRFMTVKTPTRLDHEEHGAIPYAAGDYTIVNQYQYQPRELPRQVAD